MTTTMKAKDLPEDDDACEDARMAWAIQIAKEANVVYDVQQLSSLGCECFRAGWDAAMAHMKGIVP